MEIRTKRNMKQNRAKNSTFTKFCNLSQHQTPSHTNRLQQRPSNVNINFANWLTPVFGHFGPFPLCLVDCPTQPICTWIFICWVGSGYSIQGVVKCLSPYFMQHWAFLTNFLAKYTCHRHKWELKAKNWFIEVENMPKKHSFFKKFS